MAQETQGAQTSQEALKASQGMEGQFQTDMPEVLQDGIELGIEVLADEIEAGDADGSIGSTFEERSKKYKERIKHFILMNDPLMRVVFNDIPTLEYLLRVIMKDPSLKVIDKTIQADYKNLEGHSVILDIVAVDGNGVIYNIEIQQKPEGAVPERARYNAGMVDSKELTEGEDFTKLPNSFIIFITDKDESERILSDEVIPAINDLQGETDAGSDVESGSDEDIEKPYVHRIVRVDADTGRIFKDRQTIIYINSRMPDKTALGKLMHDFHCEDPDDMYCKPISDRVRKIKETPEEVENMCREMDKIYNSGEIDGERIGKVKVALNMINNNFPADQIVSMTELSNDDVNRLIERKKKKEAALQPA